MPISRLSRPVLSRSLTPLFLAVALTACSTEEDFTDPGALADTGVQGATPDPVSEPSPATAPVAALSVSASRIMLGQSTTLSWSSADADDCSASGDWSGPRTTEGSQIIKPIKKARYTLTCTGAGGSASDSVDVAVDTPPPPLPVVNLSVSSANIEQGQPATLSWSSSNASSCTASGGWSGTRSTRGSVTVRPAATTSYALNCSGAGGSVSRSVSVTVSAPPPAPVLNLSVSSANIEQGQPATLSWSSSNASSCTASGGWSGTRSTRGSVTVRPAATTSYALNCSGAGGSVRRSVSVTVTAPPPVPVASLSASAASIQQGQTSVLSWSASNASSCTASGAWSGARSTSGSVSVSPTATSTYGLTCSGAGGSVSRSVTVTVTAPPQQQDITISWIPPAEREDGTAISMTEIAGYRVYYGTATGVYTNQVDVAGGDTMQATLGGLTSGTYYIVVSTLDTDGRESAHSMEVVRSL